MNRILSSAVMGLGLALAARAAAVRVVSSFEWEEYAPRASRTLLMGEPIQDSPKPAFRATPYGTLDDVGRAGFQIFSRKSSRDWPGALLVRQHATHGQFALRFVPGAGEMGAWRRLEQALRTDYPPPWPAREPLYDAHDHWFQRMAQVYRIQSRQDLDWSGHDRLRVDVRAVGQPLTLGVRVRDGSGPRLRGKRTGIRTALALFDVPADRTVTCEFPLAEMARIAELDLAKVTRFHIRLNGLPTGKAPEALFLDHVRLVAEGAAPAPARPIVAMKTPVRPFARPVAVRPPTARDPRGLRRRLGAVAPLGPVVINQAALYAGHLGHGSGHFGKSGATYMSNARRACVAYDNQRLVVVLGGTASPPDRGAQPRGGTIALASFDGGTTWRGLTARDRDFTVLPWHLRANFSADPHGNVYAVGTPNCDSYQEGQDICIHRLAFTGTTWVDDRFGILHQDGYKCPAHCYATALASGRIWAAWTDGFGGSLARCSDDDGFTWQPCKDAAVEKVPRPFHEPTLEALGQADAAPPPKHVLLWPSTPVPGSWLVPYRDHVAVFSADGSQWAFHDGTRWSATQKGVKIGGLLTVTALGKDQLFLCRGARYSDLGVELVADLVVAHLRDGQWHVETLEKGKTIGSAIVTASGNAVYCFYVKKRAGDEGPTYEVRYRRYEADAWGPSVQIATEARRINHLAAPQICPPTYAAVFWDQHFRSRADPSEVKFVRVPNGPSPLPSAGGRAQGHGP